MSEIILEFNQTVEIKLPTSPNLSIAMPITQGVKGEQGNQGIQGSPGSGVKITHWVAGTYASGDQVNHLGKDWVSNATIVAGDIPGTSTKWVERLSTYVDNTILSTNVLKSKRLSQLFYSGQGYDASGNLVVSASFISTEKLSVNITGNTTFTLVGMTTPAGASGTNLRLFNASGVLISSIASTSFIVETETLTPSSKVVVADTNVKFIALQATISNVSDSSLLSIWEGGPFLRNDVKIINENLTPNALKKSDVLTYQTNLAKLLPTGYRYSGTGGILVGGQLYTGIEKIPCVSSDSFTIAINTIGTAVNIGALFNSSGVNIGAITRASAVATTGGWKITIPVDVNIASFYLFFTTSEVTLTSLVVVKATSIVAPTIKPEFIPIGKTKLSEFINDSKFQTQTDLFNAIAPDLVTDRYFGYNWSTASTPILNASANYSALNKMACTYGGFLAIQGLSAKPTSASMGRFLKSDGTFHSSIVSTSLIQITGGYKLPITNDALITHVVLFFDNAVIIDLSKIIVQEGSLVQLPMIKPALVPIDTVGKSNAEALLAMNRGKETKVSTASKMPGIIILSQSQFDGRLPVSTIPLPTFFTSAGNTIVDCIINNSNTLTNFNNIHQYDITDLSNTQTKWSPEILLFKKILDYNKAVSGHSTDKIYVTKTSLGGTSFSINNGEGAGKWNYDFQKIEQFATNQIKLLSVLESRINQMITTNGSLFENRVCIVVQGESDRLDAVNYYQNLKNGIYYLRGVLQKPTFPFILVGINSVSSQYNEIVENAKIQLAGEDGYIKYVPTTGSTTLDGIHWDLATSTTVSDDIYNMLLANKSIFNVLN